LAHSR